MNSDKNENTILKANVREMLAYTLFTRIHPEDLTEADLRDVWQEATIADRASFRKDADDLAAALAAVGISIRASSSLKIDRKLTYIITRPPAPAYGDGEFVLQPSSEGQEDPPEIPPAPVIGGLATG